MILSTQSQVRLGTYIMLTVALSLGCILTTPAHSFKKAQASITTKNMLAQTSQTTLPEAVFPETTGQPGSLQELLSKQDGGQSANSDHNATREMRDARSSQNTTQKTPKEIHKDAQDRAQYTDGGTPVMTATDKREILWLARILYSETKRTHEQRLVAWVVRNRVDTGYTGQTYEEVANHSAQFSGLQPSDPRYEHNMSRWWASNGESWESALKIAKEVYFAPESHRPFSVTTRHFYSPVAVSKPAWAHGREAVRVVKSTRHHAPRFAFYDRVR
jgi:hypothetical protein